VYVAAVDNGQLLLDQARVKQKPIFLVTAHTVAPDRNGQHRPGLLLSYYVTDEEHGMSWSFQEVAFPMLGGQIDLRGTLYDYIWRHRPPGIVVETSQESGAY
jgi:hypothetical protein